VDEIAYALTDLILEVESITNPPGRLADFTPGKVTAPISPTESWPRGTRFEHRHGGATITMVSTP